MYVIMDKISFVLGKKFTRTLKSQTNFLHKFELLFLCNVLNSDG